MRRLLLIPTMLCALICVAPATSHAAVASTQLYEARFDPVASPPTGSSQIGSGTGLLKGLGLDEPVVARVFASSGSTMSILITGESPLIVREVLPVAISDNGADPDLGLKLHIVVPRNLQSPAPGVIATLMDLSLTFPAQVSGGSALFSSTGCGLSWASRLSVDYTDNFEGSLVSNQQVPTTYPCQTPATGPMQVKLRPYFADISPDLNVSHQFAPVNIYFDLPKNLQTGLGAFPACAGATVFADAALCPTGPGGGGPAGQGTPGPTGPPGPAGKDGKDGKLVIVAYQVKATAKKVTVSYVLTGASTVTLRVARQGGKRVAVAAAKGREGLNKISWNRRINGKAAKKGRYTLSLTPLGTTKSSSIRVVLK